MNAPPNKRLEMLEKLASSPDADSFARYGLAMEYRKAGRIEDALAAFERLRAADAGYVPMYLMAGQMLLDAERTDAAREWLRAGLEVATAKGDSKAKNELAQALALAD
ncbi:MAG TPA: tetratricopeptide repeat protein [Polyangiaceae bacterium]|nr:tetratricopeptide repeat protein [Polyangiaceae bacterium]